MVGEGAAQVAKSIQSLTVAHQKHEDLNNNGQAQIIGHALSSVDATQKDQDFQRTIDQLRIITEYSKNDSMLRCLIKSQMAEASQQWEDHSYDVRHFIGSFSSLSRRL